MRHPHRTYKASFQNKIQLSLLSFFILILCCGVITPALALYAPDTQSTMVAKPSAILDSPLFKNTLQANEAIRILPPPWESPEILSVWRKDILTVDLGGPYLTEGDTVAAV